MGLSSYMLQPTKMRGNIYVGFHKRGYRNSWMVYFRENPTKMDDLGVPLFLETPIYTYIYIHTIYIYIYIHNIYIQYIYIYIQYIYIYTIYIYILSTILQGYNGISLQQHGEFSWLVLGHGLI